jgi:nucleoid DNA-binding protein
VWWQTSQFIAEQLSNKKGVAILGLGTFTLTEKKTEMGTQGTVVKHTPVFVLSDRFASRGDVEVRSVNVAGNIPVNNLNLSYLAQVTGLEKQQVEASIREVLMALTRQIDEPRGIALALYGIGWLSVKRRKVRFTFYRRFLNDPKPSIGRPPTRSDLSSRCGTAGVLGGRPASRAQGDRPRTRGATPLLFGGNIAEGDVPHGKMHWQSSLRSERFFEVMDPLHNSDGSLPYDIKDVEKRGRYMGEDKWKGINGGAGVIYEEGKEVYSEEVTEDEVEQVSTLPF